MRQKDIKVFGDVQSGRLNSDDSPFALTTNEWVNAENVRTGTTDKGATGIMESVGGNVQIDFVDTVVIGTQEWSLRNLDVTTYRNGDPIPEIQDPIAWATTTEGAWCYYDNNPANEQIYGKLYNWYAVNDPRGLAPKGYHVPTIDEWGTLETTLGGSLDAGGQLKEAGTLHWLSPNTDATNSSGWTGLPGSFRFNDGVFDGGGGISGYWWSSTGDLTIAFYRFLSYNISNLLFNGSDSHFGFSVRLLKDEDYDKYKTIGTIEDTENERLVYFNYDTDVAREDEILCLYTKTNTIYTVLKSSQVENGLNFDLNSLIHSAHIVNGILSWTDGTNNEPRKINIESGISANYPTFITENKAYIFPLNFDEITLIKPPPIYPPNIQKKYDVAFIDNFISNVSFQFAYQYVFYDKETTVVSPYSISSNINSPDESLNGSISALNYIQISMDYRNKIPSTIRYINLIARYSVDNSAFIIKTWDRDNAIDNSEMILHNIGASSLPFNFYNNISGEYLAPDDVLRPFDNVPIYSQTHEIAKQRYYLANNINGYDTPTITSMNLETISFIPGTISTKLISVRLSGSNVPKYGYSAWYVYLTYPQIGYYVINDTQQYTYGSDSIPVLPTPPTTQTYPAGMTYKGLNQEQVIRNTLPSIYTYTNTFNEFILTNNDINIVGLESEYYNAFPQNSNYVSGIVFYDYAMRKCGVVTDGNCNVSIPARTFSYSPSTQYPGSYAIDKIKWTLSNIDAINEIPEWAYYYAPVLTKNQNKRYFIQSFNYKNEMKYVKKNADGTLEYSSYYTNGCIYLALNTSALIQSGLGYVYSDGDTCILTYNSDLPVPDYTQIIKLSVYGQDGNYILLKLNKQTILSINIPTNVSVIYEIYNPYKTNKQEPYYEVGQLYSINNPKTIDREYSYIFGYFNADAYIVKRTYKNSSSNTDINYIANAMSPNDLYYQNWVTDAGKVNIVTKIGQINNNFEIVFSDSYISGTEINGGSTFRLGNNSFVSDDCGSIIKIQNTAKVQDQGSVMLAICTTETNSMYLGETQITDSTGGTKFFSSGTSVIGTINILKGNYGCINPESVVQYRGNVYFFDANNGRWVQYSANGLDNISAIKMTRFWKNWSYKYLSMTKDEIEALGNRPYVFATVDSAHDELLISIPKLSETPPKGFLPDYPDDVYPFDILDYQGKTIVYKLGTGAVVQPHWQGAYTFNTEYFAGVQNRLFTFKDGYIYEHNQDNQNEFFGVQYDSKIMFTSNILPQVPKVYDNILTESNFIPNFVYFYNEYPNLQTSDLESVDFADVEGIWYASILRNKVVETNTGDVYTGLLTGEVMRNTNMYVLVRFSPTTSPLQLRLLQLSTSISKGHTF